MPTQGYKIPPILNPPRRCVTIQIPDETYHIAAFWGALGDLARWYNWETTGDTQGAQVARVWREIIEEAHSHFVLDECGEVCFECKDYKPNSHLIEWQPNHPYLTPDLIPDGYQGVPWYAPQQDLFPGAHIGDVFTDITCILGAEQPGDLSGFLPGLVQSGLPRFTFRFSGTGSVLLHFVTIPLGGLAFVNVDNALLGNRFVDLAGFEIDDLDDWISVFNILGLGIFSGTLVQERIIELPITTEGDHEINVTMIPKLSLSSPGFGGGIRKIKLCGDIVPEVNMGIEDIRIEDCNLEIKVNGDWISRGSLLENITLSAETLPAGEDATVTTEDCEMVFGIPRGSTGLQGQQGIPGRDGQDGTDGADGNILNLVPTAEPDSTKSVAQIRCAIAIGLGQWLVDKFNDALDTLEASSDAVAALDAWLVFIGPVYLVADQVIDLFNEISEAGVNILRAQLDTDNIFRVKEQLYCNLSSTTGELTLEAWEEYKDDLSSFLPSPLSDAFGTYLATLNGEAVVRKSNIYSYGDGDNPECLEFDDCQNYDWEHTFDFTLSNQGWETYNSAGGSYVAGGGWSYQDAISFGLWYRACAIRFTLPSAAHVTSVSMLFNLTKGFIYSGGEGIVCQTVGFDGAEQVVLFSNASSGNGQTLEKIGDDENTTILSASLWCSGAGNQAQLSGSLLIRSVTVRGQGTNPFV